MADEATPGLVAWTASIRTAMINDPARQGLHDLIQDRGFLFLDDYLANILAGPKQEYVSLQLFLLLLILYSMQSYRRPR
jgi:hypothetical protein